MRNAKNCRNNVAGKRWRFWPRRRKVIVNDDGSVTIEFVLWVPIFVLILALTVDSSIVFMTQANMWAVTRDTTRAMSTGLYTKAAGEAYAVEKMDSWANTPTVVADKVSFPGYVVVTMTVDVADVAPFNVVGVFTNGSISTSLKQRMEPH